jgi:hypothetical protein
MAFVKNFLRPCLIDGLLLFITAGPITKRFEWGDGESGGLVSRLEIEPF